MKAIKMRKLLDEAIDNNKDAEVVMHDGYGYRKFTGFNVDDLGDVDIYICGYDEKH